ncbi:MAG: glycosyltransferase family 2 protein [Bacilli bacterium]|nr:glycosyltransferase family 2 protein [Bacilli bacterium]
MSDSFCPLVSIITPAYNASSFIEATIDSVIKQDYSNWEMIIINDFSSDTTGKIIDEYSKKDKRIVVINNPSNQGVARSRNNGIKAAKGKYIAFLDSDDLWKENKLTKHIGFMEENNIAITYSYYETFSSDASKPTKLIKCPKKATYKSILKSNFMGCLTVVVNKSVTGDFLMPDLDHGEDMLTWYELMKRGFVAVCVSEPLASYRISNKSLSSNKKKTAKKQWNIYRKFLGFSYIKSLFYFCLYAIKGIIKHH